MKNGNIFCWSVASIHAKHSNLEHNHSTSWKKNRQRGTWKRTRACVCVCLCVKERKYARASVWKTVGKAFSGDTRRARRAHVRRARDRERGRASQPASRQAIVARARASKSKRIFLCPLSRYIWLGKCLTNDKIAFPCVYIRETIT